MSVEEDAERQRPEVAVCYAGRTYLGTLVSTRVEWAKRDTVLVSIVVQTDTLQIRFYFETDDTGAWAALETNPPRVIEAEAMRVEGRS